MSHRKSLLPFFLAALAPLALGGCAGVLIAGGLAAAGGVGYEAAQERGLNGTVDDFSIKTNIEAAYLKQNPNMQSNVTVTVYDGRVLLTGLAATPAFKAQAGDIARRTGGVRAVYDELEVRNTETAWDKAQDAWITTRVRSEMVLDADIRSGNYTIDTADRSVYLIGSARTQEELKRATQIAQYVPGVGRVVSYVEIRPGASATAQYPQEPQYPASSAPAPSSGPPAPSAPIQVQRLN